VLVEEGFATFADNPDHKRAKLVRLTTKGRAALDEVNARQAAWTTGLADGFRGATILAALTVLRTCRDRLEAAEG
jgi:DNA-binding MarR family transcriptional regulator